MIEWFKEEVFLSPVNSYLIVFVDCSCSRLLSIFNKKLVNNT